MESDDALGWIELWVRCDRHCSVAIMFAKSSHWLMYNRDSPAALSVSVLLLVVLHRILSILQPRSLCWHKGFLGPPYVNARILFVQAKRGTGNVTDFNYHTDSRSRGRADVSVSLTC
jgi:hypothetical protein